MWMVFTKSEANLLEQEVFFLMKALSEKGYLIRAKVVF
jgi:hypothetical protein